MAKKFLTPIQSTVATGTAPFTIASTTVITNLNADLLDGQHGTYYAAASSLSNYQPIDADLTAIAGISATSGLLKKTASNTWTLDTTAYTTNTGTVTSVGVSVPTGLSVSGSPITSSGTLALSLASGYEIPTTAALDAKAPIASPTFTGQVTTNSHVVAGEGSGSVSLSINDGYGNANVAWNHHQGKPDTNGNAARIEVNVDSTSGANMNFELKSNVTAETAVGLTSIFNLSETVINAYVPIAGQTPTSSNHLTTKAYVDSAASGGGLDPFLLGGM